MPQTLRPIDRPRRLPTLLADLEQMLEDRFDLQWGGEGARSPWTPRVDVEETDEAYVVRVELAGVEPDAIDVDVVGDMLTIRGEREFYEEATEEGFTRRERHFGAFERSLRLQHPVDVDAIEARHANGVLTVRVPRSDEPQRHRIAVTSED